MYKIKQYINHVDAENEIDFKYKHLTEEEIKSLYGEDISCNSKVTLSNRFKDRYRGLEDFENQVNLNLLETNKYNDTFPHWYIFRLVEYGRINLKLEVLMNIRLYRNNFLNTNSRLINLEFIMKFEETATKLEYDKEYLEQSITIYLLKAIIYLRATEGNLIEKLYEYKKEIDLKISLDLVKKRAKSILVPISIILKEMGYEIDTERFKTKSVSTEDILDKLNPSLKESVQLYKDNFKNKRGSYFQSQCSHIRVFFKFLNDKYHEVDNISKIKNIHITGFIESQINVINIQGKKNTKASINRRIRAVGRMINFLRSTGKYEIADNIITKYDLLRETKTFQRYVSEEELYKLIDTILNADVEEKYEQHREVLKILMDTGRRIHEVLVLDYYCVRDGQVYFHKTKKGESNWQEVGETTLDAIRVLRKHASMVSTPIYSKVDGLTIRRLVPSRAKNGRSLINQSTINMFFKKMQLKHDIVEEDGSAKYTAHDLKRVFNSCLTNAGVSPEMTAKFLDQDINNLVPYEISNALPIKTLKKVERKGLLVGKKYDNKLTLKESLISNILNNVDVVSRNRMNLMSKINNPSESLPQFLGYCIDIESYKTCGDLICVACDEFITDSFEDFVKYTEKIYRNIYSYKRNKEVKNIEKKVIKSLDRCYKNIEDDAKEDFDKVMREIKKKVRKDVEYEKGK